MQSLVPGLSVSDNLILAEELPAPPGVTYRVWHALNLQLGQIVIIKVDTDGRVESIETSPVSTTPLVSNAPPVSETQPSSNWNVSPSNLSASIPPVSAPAFNPIGPPTSTPVSQPTLSSPNNPFRSTDAPIPKAVRKQSKGWLRYVLAGILLVGVATAGYYYRKPLRSYRKSIVRLFHSMGKAHPDTLAKHDNSAPATKNQQNPDTVILDTLPPQQTNLGGASTSSDSTATMPADAPTPSTDKGTSSNSVVPITAPQAARLLSLISKIPPEKHPAIFVDAQQAFTNLRQSSGRQSYIDSLYTIYKGWGAQSFLTYQQNGDPVSKRYAIDWYHTAYALKPDPNLRERIARLINSGQPNKAKPVRKPAKNTSPNFMRDPEVNR
ncbi:hypothetical protein GCM10028808_39630 [Spirosoma migulaei]